MSIIPIPSCPEDRLEAYKARLNERGIFFPADQTVVVAVALDYVNGSIGDEEYFQFLRGAFGYTVGPTLGALKITRRGQRLEINGLTRGWWILVDCLPSHYYRQAAMMLEEGVEKRACPEYLLEKAEEEFTAFQR